MNIDGTAVIMIGGASGLGLATAAALLCVGGKVAVFHENGSRGDAAAKQFEALFLHADVVDAAGVACAFAEAEGAQGMARILVNCAGIAPLTPLFDSSDEAAGPGAFAKVLAVNLVGTLNAVAAFAARLVRVGPIGEERGVVVNSSSIAAFEGQAAQSAYSASKSGVTGLSLPLARELADHAIRVAAIAPGLFRTPILDALPAEAVADLANRIPFPRRLGQPGEFAYLVQAIVRNPMINGVTIRLDGALRMTSP